MNRHILSTREEGAMSQHLLSCEDEAACADLPKEPWSPFVSVSTTRTTAATATAAASRGHFLLEDSTQENIARFVCLFMFLVVKFNVLVK